MNMEPWSPMVVRMEKTLQKSEPARGATYLREKKKEATAEKSLITERAIRGPPGEIGDIREKKRVFCTKSSRLAEGKPGPRKTNQSRKYSR